MSEVTPPNTGQKTQRQYTSSIFGGGHSSAPGIDVTAPFANVWSGWGSLLWGTYWTYRTMLRHPTVAYVMSQVIGPVQGGTWLVDADEDAPEDVTQWVEDNIIVHRSNMITHALRAVVFGNSPFEVVWGMNAGQYVIEQFVPLLQDATRVLREENGKGAFNGVENGPAKLSRAECLYIVNCSEVMGNEPGDDYGRSRLENIRDTAWLGWIDTARRLAELEDRVSGVVPKWEVPKTAADADGKTMADYAKAALPDLNHPRSLGVVIENPALGEVDPDAAPGVYKQLQSQLTTLDMGNRAPSQAAMLDKLKYWDTKIGEGLYRGARTLFATMGGTKADAEQHTANAEPDAEAIDMMIAEQINCQTARTGLTLNFGQDIIKKVRGIKPAPLVDQDQRRANATITTLLANPTLSTALAEFWDMDKLSEQARIPAHQDVTFQGVLDKAQSAADAAKKAAQPTNQPPTNGNPQNGNRVDLAINRIARRAR